MAYEGGYTSALNSISDRDLKAIETLVRQQQMRQQATVFQQQQEQQRKQQQAKAALGNMLPQLLGGMGAPPAAGGPQPPMPGQPSVPMMPPGGGGMPGMPPPPQGAAPAPMPGMPPPQGGMPPAGMPPGGMPPMPPPPAQGQGAPMAKAGGPGAPPMPVPGGPPVGAAPPAPPQGWQGLPKPPEDAPAGPGGIPPPPEDAVMPKQLISVQDLSKLLAAKGIKGEQAMDMIEQWKPFMDSQNKAQLDTMKMQNTAQAAAIKAYQAALRDAEHARHNKVEEGQGEKRLAQGQQRININVGGAAGGTKLTEDAKELAARQYKDTGQMPTMYKDQKSRVEIMNRAAELAKQEGESLADIPSKRQDFKANSAALTQNTKDLAAIGPYNDMLEKNGNIAIDLAKKAVASDAKLANRPLNWIRQNAGDNPDVAEFLAQAQIVSTEAARVLNNPRLVGQLTDSARHEMESIINGDMPLQSFTRVVQRMQQDGRNRVSAMERKHKQLMDQLSGKAGKDEPAREFASEDEAKAAKLAPGTKVKINGVSGTWQ